MVALLFAILAVPTVFCIPPPLDDRPAPPGVTSERDHALLRILPQPRAAAATSFKYKYVGEHGVIADSKGNSGHWFEIAATLAVSELAHQKAATIISRMTIHMPLEIFDRLCTHARAGIFTVHEHLSIYPEYYHLANTAACKTSCAGSCVSTCTFDGRKYETLAGVGGRRCVILDDNLLCDRHDPYGHRDNILVHEFTHTVHQYAVTSQWQHKITEAYNNAKAHHIWAATSYAMSNSQEYFAEASGTFFNAEHMISAAGGMNMCSGRLCTSETAMRENLRQKDPELYAVLSHVFTSDQPHLGGHLGPCV